MDVGGNIASDPYAEATGTAFTLETTSTSGDIIAHGPPGAEFTGEDTDDLQITGTVSQINSYLADNWGLVALGIVVVAGIIIIWKWDDINNLIKNFSNPSTKQLRMHQRILMVWYNRTFARIVHRVCNKTTPVRQPDNPTTPILVTHSLLHKAGLLMGSMQPASSCWRIHASRRRFPSSSPVSAV